VIIVIGIAGDSLAALNSVSRLANQALQESKQYFEELGIDTSDIMQQTGAATDMPGKAPLGFLMFVAVVGAFQCVVELLRATCRPCCAACCRL
jgi:hypothetical protein